MAFKLPQQVKKKKDTVHLVLRSPLKLANFPLILAFPYQSLLSWQSIFHHCTSVFLRYPMLSPHKLSQISLFPTSICICTWIWSTNLVNTQELYFSLRFTYPPTPQVSINLLKYLRAIMGDFFLASLVINHVHIWFKSNWEFGKVVCWFVLLN